jgi:hypothetical protein
MRQTSAAIRIEEPRILGCGKEALDVAGTIAAAIRPSMLRNITAPLRNVTKWDVRFDLGRAMQR